MWIHNGQPQRMADTLTASSPLLHRCPHDTSEPTCSLVYLKINYRHLIWSLGATKRLSLLFMTFSFSLPQHGYRKDGFLGLKTAQPFLSWTVFHSAHLPTQKCKKCPDFQKDFNTQQLSLGTGEAGCSMLLETKYLSKSWHLTGSSRNLVLNDQKRQMYMHPLLQQLSLTCP